jgi:ATP-binding cassette subfamily B protein
MNEIIQKFKIFYEDLKQVSKLTKTKGKKLKLFGLGVIVNFIAALDILVILYFSSFFTFNFQLDNSMLIFLIERKYLLPVFVLMRFFLIYIERVLITNLQFSVQKNLQIYLIQEVFKRGNISTGDAFYYTQAVATQVGNFYSTLATLIGSFLQIIAFSAYLITTNFVIILVFGIGSIVLLIPTLYLTKKGRGFAHITYTIGGKINKVIEKIIDNFFLIKILKMTDSEINDFDTTLKKYYAARVSEIKIGTLNAILPNFITLFSLSVMLVWFSLQKYITLDFIGILLRLFQSLGLMNKNIHAISAFHVYLEKLYEIEKYKESVYPENYIFDKDLDKDVAIEFKDVSFKYLGSDFYLFDDLNLKIYKNKHTLITGFNGSGKSTLLGLATGIFYPEKGTVYSISNKIGYISANPMILNASLRENINYGNNNHIQDLSIKKYIKDFQVFKENENIDLDRPISNKSLSMGQMQKISYIRALVSGIDILILDESTSNLDNDSKRLIYNILSEKKLTIINSTHNPEDFKDYDFHIQITEGSSSRKINIKKND